jgi:5'-nucleotidase / UDP-sugar diphosphatase
MALVRFDKGEDQERLLYALTRDFSSSECNLLPPRISSERPFILDIFHINDLHSHVFEHGRYTFGTLAAKVKEARAAAGEGTSGPLSEEGDRAVLFLSAGDDLIGTSLDHFVAYGGDDFIGHPAYTAYALEGVDAVTLGNHDFDMGLSTLKRSIETNAAFPVLSANLEHGGVLEGLVFPAAIAVLKGLRVGIIGLTTPGQCRSREGSFYTISDPQEAVTNIVETIRPHCDVIILLSHLGLALGSTFAAVKGFGDTELAMQLPPGEVDLIVGGHTHDLLHPEGLDRRYVINGIPVLQAGCNGQYLGHAQLHIKDEVHCSDARLYRADSLPPPKNAGLPFFRTPIGRSLDMLYSPIAPLSVPPGFSFSQSGGQKGSWEDPLANYVADALEAELVQLGLDIDVVAIDGSSLMGTFPDGVPDLTLGEIYHLMPYADTINLFTLTGEMVRQLVVENSYRRSSNQEERRERGFLYFSRELRYSFLSTGEPMGRGQEEPGVLQELTIHGKAPLSEKAYTIAAPNYLQGIAKAWEKSEEHGGRDFLNIHEYTSRKSSIYVRKLLLDHIIARGVREEEGLGTDGRARFSSRQMVKR